jgi:hypothetical protein
VEHVLISLHYPGPFQNLFDWFFHLTPFLTIRLLFSTLRANCFSGNRCFHLQYSLASCRWPHARSPPTLHHQPPWHRHACISTASDLSTRLETSPNLITTCHHLSQPQWVPCARTLPTSATIPRHHLLGYNYVNRACSVPPSI